MAYRVHLIDARRQHDTWRCCRKLTLIALRNRSSLAFHGNKCIRVAGSEIVRFVSVASTQCVCPKVLIQEPHKKTAPTQASCAATHDHKTNQGSSRQRAQMRVNSVAVRVVAIIRGEGLGVSSTCCCINCHDDKSSGAAPLTPWPSRRRPTDTHLKPGFIDVAI